MNGDGMTNAGEGHAALGAALHIVADLLLQNATMDRLVQAVQAARSLTFTAELESERRATLMGLLQDLGDRVARQQEFDSREFADQLRTAADLL